jgi:hypothetical protein
MRPHHLLLLASTALVTACSQVSDRHPVAQTGSAGSVAALVAEPASPESRQAYFGNMHLHTSFSWDAWEGPGGVNVTPDQAYHYSQGDPVDIGGQIIRRDVPLDFTAVTDHAEYMGVLNQLGDPGNPLSTLPSLADFRAHPRAAFMQLYYHIHKGRPIPADLQIGAGMRNAWAKEVAAANANYHPGRFTTFIAYEWSSMPGGENNLHRNVIFSGDDAPMPFSVLDSTRPEDLWSYLERSRKNGFQVIAIPHNSNASGGLMFDWVDSNNHPIDEAYAQRRALNEPLAEIYQIKGNSETHPDLSPNDEFNNFEKWETLLVSPHKSEPKGGYLRDALGRGLILQDRVGVNPYKLGFTADTDIHTGLNATSEDSFNGRGGYDPKVNTPDREAVKKLFAPKLAFDFMAERQTDVQENPVKMSGAGLTGVWAEENTRPSIFAALRRRETFATSGTRLKVRFFGGWNYDTNLVQKSDWTQAAYRNGVPMGSDLPAAPEANIAPSFVLWAVKDPNNANLDRIQVVKVWLDGGYYKEKVFDVAWSDGRKVDSRTGRLAPVGNTVDLKTAAYRNSIGSAELKTVWRDPEFDPSRPAVYYARVIQIPTPRWSTYLAVRRDLPIPTTSPATIQERGWSSPIWYTPTGYLVARRSDVAQIAPKPIKLAMANRNPVRAPSEPRDRFASPLVRGD